MNKDVRFYYGNLVSDVIRSISASLQGDDARYRHSLKRAYKTLAYLRGGKRPEVYEEGLLLLRALAHARARGTLGALRKHLASAMQSFGAV